MMTDLPNLSLPLLNRRGLIAAGLAGTASLLAAPRALHAQGAPGAAAPSAVIDVNRARTDPIPIAIPDFAGAGEAGQIGRDMANVITNDLARSGLFRPIDRAAFLSAGQGAGDVPNFQNWRAIGAQALVTGKADSQGGGSVRVEFRLWDVLPQTQIQGTAYTATLGNWRRIAHIISDVIYERLLGEKGYFDTRIVYIAGTGPREQAHQAPGDHGPGQREQPLPDRRLLAGADAALPPDARPDRVHELRQQPPARLPVRPRLRPPAGARRFRGHDLFAPLRAGRQQRDHVGDQRRRRVGHRHRRAGRPARRAG